MKILYGVVGEGMGHAMRSRVTLDHLIKQGHEVEIMVSGRAEQFLAKRFHGVNRIHGFHIIYEENRVKKGSTLWSNALQGAAGLPGNIAAYFDLIREFKPDLVISDFESWTYLYGKTHRLPIISIDNMQIINRCTHAPEILEGARTDFEVTKAFIKGKLPFCEHYFITTFFYPPVRKDRTTLVPPILRPEILATTPTRGDHLLVYQTGEGYTTLLDTLQKSGVECRIYGMRRGITEEQVEGNLRFRPFSEQGFIDDMASSKGVIAGGGFTTMGEAVYLKKPMLAVPIEHQFEQVMNARYLEKEGFGIYAHDQDSNKKLHEVLGALLDKGAADLL